MSFQQNSGIICPINHEKFTFVNQITQNPEATLLYSQLLFWQNGSKFTDKLGRPCIIRTRAVLAQALGCCGQKIDALLALLVSKGLIAKAGALYKGVRKLKISAFGSISDIPVNFEAFNALLPFTGDTKTAILFSHVLFRTSNTKIVRESKKWCALTYESLAKWSGYSVSTVKRIILFLVKKGLIMKGAFAFRGKRKLHIHVVKHVVEKLKHVFAALSERQRKTTINTEKVTHTENDLDQKLKNQIPIRKGRKSKENINITKRAGRERIDCGDISFEKVTDKLSTRQSGYLRKALSNAIQRDNCAVTSPQELLTELAFSIENAKHQHSGILSFKHLVNRCMALVRANTWRTPKGFKRKHQEGEEAMTFAEKQQALWAKQKQEEMAAYA